MSGYDALDELYERLRGQDDAKHARRAGEITPETIRAARGGVADEIGRIPETAAESAARADSVPLVDVSRDTRERIEADAWEAARLDMSRTWEERRDAIVALLDRQAALTEREVLHELRTEGGGAMSMFGLQIKELREKADELRNVRVDDENVGLLFAAIGAMRDAADTIDNLQKRLAKCRIYACDALLEWLRGDAE